MPEDTLKAACPACGRRFRLAAADLAAAGAAGRSARCRGCGLGFDVVPGPQGVVVRVAGEAAAEGPAAPDDPPPEGARLPDFELGVRVGRYEVEGVLGRGGMGTIYRAYDPAANRSVALKVLSAAATGLDVLRFRREIEVQGNIQHPHIMPIYDSGVVGRTRYYVMELLKDPVDLIELVELMRSGEAARDPRLRPVAGLEGLIERVLIPVADAVFHANVNEGVLHRDIKPGNVLVDRSGLRPYLIDFGVSAVLDKRNTRLAHMDRALPVPLAGKGVHVTGTMVFMPPEQARGKADRRGDVWGLGALLHYAVTGAPPLEPVPRRAVPRAARIEGLELLCEQARGAGDLREAAQYERVLEDLRAGRERTADDLRREVLAGRYRSRPSSLDRALEAIIARALDPDPERRYRHAGELREDLRAFLDRRPVRALVRGRSAATGTLYRARLLLRRHPLWALTAAAGLGLLGLLLALGSRPGDAGGPPRAEALLAQAADEAARGDRAAARRLAREAIEAAPRDAERAFDLLARLERMDRLDAALERARHLARGLRAAARARDAQAVRAAQGALAEVLTTGILPLLDPSAPPAHEAEVESLRRLAAGQARVRLDALPAGARLFVRALERARGPLAPEAAVRALAPGDEALAPGAYVLLVRGASAEVWIPFEVAPGDEEVALRCPIDPAQVPPGMAYVPGGRTHGPGGLEEVAPLFWDRVEVTEAEYARFLATRPVAEQRRRVPRVPDPLGLTEQPMWDLRADGYEPPPSAAVRPVEGISLYDAQAYAAWAGKRLPTAAEWAHAAAADGRETPLGTVLDLLAAGARLDAPVAGPGRVGRTPGDTGLFGLYDLAGNLAEFTATYGRLRGRSGWWVMGGSYLLGPEAALVRSARVVAGWQPLEAVGLRCVRDVPTGSSPPR